MMYVSKIYNSINITNTKYNKNIIEYINQLFTFENDVCNLSISELKYFLHKIKICLKINNIELAKNNNNITKYSLLIQLFKIRKQIMDKYDIQFDNNYELKYLVDVDWNKMAIIQYEDRYVTPEEIKYFCN
jgi:hypothetical protein